MYELSVACKYLLPRWRQLSVSIISIISIIVISLVVWLVVVFFSVTDGLERSWIQKLIALTAPIRITPTENYYGSYYYLIDNISAQSGYSSKTIAEKLLATAPNPYDEGVDEELPAEWPAKDVDVNGELKDLVKLAFDAVNNQKQFSSLKANAYEQTFTNLKIYLDPQRAIRPLNNLKGSQQNIGQQRFFIAQNAFLGSIDSNNKALVDSLRELSVADINNLLFAVTDAEDIAAADGEMIPSSKPLEKNIAAKRLQKFLAAIKITSLRTPAKGWPIPQHLLPSNESFQACALLKNQRLATVILPQKKGHCNALLERMEAQGFVARAATVTFQNGQMKIAVAGIDIKSPAQSTPLLLEGDVVLRAKRLDRNAAHCNDLCFDVSFDLQGVAINGEVAFRGLQLDHAEEIALEDSHDAFWKYGLLNTAEGKQLILNKDEYAGEAVLLPKAFRDAGALVGDRGYLAHHTPTASAVIEQKLPFYVAGFYDPGIIPMGGKYILANSELTSLISAAHNRDNSNATNGIHLRFDELSQANAIKEQLQNEFQKLGIAPYWKIETFREYEFTKDLLQQLKSEKHLFSLIATVVIIVACSNIISMLIILVNDKKLEIGIMRSMGATSASIALIFGLCGIIMGVLGSLIGIGAAVITLNNIQVLVELISKIQGHDLFNPVFYGDKLPADLSADALLFVIAVTGVISMLAGLVPATKAALLNPSAVLKSE